MASIGMVDDNPTALAHMQRVLRHAGMHDLRAHQDPCQALQDFSQSPPTVLLLDYLMPGINGLKLLALLKARGSVCQTPVAMLTGIPDLGVVRLPAYQAGVHELIAKPLRPQEFALVVRNLVGLATSPPAGATDTGFAPLVIPRRPAQPPVTATTPAPDWQFVQVLHRVAGLGGIGHNLHGERTAQFATVIARYAGLDKAQQLLLRAATPLHDIGLVGMVGRGARQRGGANGPWQQHTVIGSRLLSAKSSPVLQLGAEIALSHHERWDGNGYPHGLSGAAIPLAGRIVAVADALDELGQAAPDAGPTGFVQAVTTVVAEVGTRFDPRIIRALLSGLDEIREISCQPVPPPMAADLAAT